MTCAVLLLAGAAILQDTTYGRIDGDVIGSLGAGGTITTRGPSAAFDLRARYLDTAGAFVTYEEGFGGPAEPTRVVVVGMEVRPLFLGRWLTGTELGMPWLDLVIDSFGLELGVAFLQPKLGDFGDRIALQAGIGIELPIFPRASGPWIGLHAGGRFSDRGLGQEVQTPLEQSMYFTITLAWHQSFGSRAVDVGDTVLR
jgi:hypothetical protein